MKKIILLFPGILFALFDPGTKSLVFLKNLTDAQDIALGEVSTALPCDGLSFLSNPAFLAGINRYDLSFYHTFLWQDIKQDFFVFAGSTPYLNYGISLNYLNYGKIEGRDTFGFRTEDFSAYDFALHLGIARRFSKFLKIGFSFGYAMEKIEKEKASSFVFSFGTKYILPNFSPLKLGFSITNLGSSAKFIQESSPPPTTIKFGFLYRTPKFPYFFAGDIVVPFDDTPYIALGAGANVFKILELRAGIRSGVDTGFLSSFRFGFGLFPTSFLSLDYAGVPRGILGLTHHISLKFQF